MMGLILPIKHCTYLVSRPNPISIVIMKKSRSKFTSEFKALAAIETLRNIKPFIEFLTIKD